MIGLVLAAGAGRRLRPHTDGVPKTLVPVDGETTILDIALRNLAHVGLRDVTIVVGYRSEAVKARQPDLEARHDVRLTLVDNDRAEDWNNCYSLWLAREHLTDGALLLNGDTVHPPSVERSLLDARSETISLAVDTEKGLADEEMKVTVDDAGRLRRITKRMEPRDAYGEYIGATLIPAGPAGDLSAALEETWRRDSDLYYEDGYQTYVDAGGTIGVVPIGHVSWVEVDDHADLDRAREIACRC